MRGERYAKAQSTAEYALVIAIVLAALVGMQTYVKRSLQAKLKGVADAVNFDTSPSGQALLQYEPYYANSSFDTTRTGTETQGYTKGAATLTSTDTTTRTGKQSEQVDTAADDQWKLQ